MLRGAGPCPTADRTFRESSSRMVLADLVLCKSRAPVSFIKHLFTFGLYQYAEGWIWQLLPMKSRIGGRDVTTRVRARRHTTLLSERGASTDWICAASLSPDSQAESPADGKDYKPVRKHFVNIFSTYPRARLNSRCACQFEELLKWRRDVRSFRSDPVDAPIARASHLPGVLRLNSIRTEN